jgi:uncharacterized RDD family membrane protein YckC
MNEEIETTADDLSQGLPKPVISTPIVPPLGSSAADSARVQLHVAGAGDGAAIPTAVPMATRVIAGAIDAVIGVTLLVMLATILPFFAGTISYLAYAGYMIARDSLPFLGGQSIGKKAMKIRAVTLDGQSLVGKWEIALIRSGVLMIPIFGFVELIVLVTREGKPDCGRRLGDEWAKTKVIFEPASPQL